MSERDTLGSVGPMTVSSQPVALPEGTDADPFVALEPLGVGGMGEVWRVRDTSLHRRVALKQLRPELADSPGARARFVLEARLTAGLQHPGVVPVHALGTFDDGSPYFVMKEVDGRTLAEVIDEVHGAVADGAWGEPGLRGLVTAFQRVCEAVAYAHAHGVVHRDLKPSNVMVGRFGEVLVLDWGIAQGAGDPVSEGVSGTPGYMAPEQEAGDNDRIGPATDVWGLGAVLHHILAGTPPSQGDVQAPVQRGGARLPDDLVELCARCRRLDPTDRLADASVVAAEVGAWLDGARRRERGLEVVAAALADRPRIAALRARADELGARAAELAATVPVWASEADKAELWRLEDTAAGLREEAALLEVQVAETLQGALTHAPELPAAHEALADHFADLHRRAEATRDLSAARYVEVRLRTHVAALPEGSAARRRHAAYLRGDGALSLHAEPTSEVTLFRFETEGRRLVPRRLGEPVPTPMDQTLTMGSYLAVLRAPGRATVRYPVLIRREEHWDGRVVLPEADAVGPDEVVVPAGWFLSGGDPEAGDAPLERVWVDGFVIGRFPVTNAQYLTFLDALVADGRTDEAMTWAPRHSAGMEREQGALLVDLVDGRFRLRVDSEGDRWAPDWPVMMVDHACAEAYAAWAAARDGLPWRLPTGVEWEKAARGVDGRAFPWGDHHDPSWCHMGHSHRGKPLPAGVDTYPVDESVYGMRGAAGNMHDWCADRWAATRNEGTRERRVVRGGSWSGSDRYGRCAWAFGRTPTNRSGTIGFRLARALPT